MKKPPRFAPRRFSVRGQRTRFKRQRGLSLAGLLICWSGSGCGKSQSLHFGAQAALVTSGLVLVEDALVGNGVDHGLHLGKQLGGFGLVARQNGFFDVFHGSAVFGAQRSIRSIDFDVLADAFAARSKTGVFLFGFSGCHSKFFRCLRMMSSEPGILADLQMVFATAGAPLSHACAPTPHASMAWR